jgi:hypothetical protein
VAAPGANFSVIARSHGLDPSRVFAWRRKALASGQVAPVSGAGRTLINFAQKCHSVIFYFHLFFIFICLLLTP